MDLRFFTQPQQGLSFADEVVLAQAAEELGFSGYFRADHYARTIGGPGAPGPPDTWGSLAGIALGTSRTRIGALVCSATFRLPGILAVTASQVDQMSGGRLDLGLGAGWFEHEHLTHG